MPLFRELTFVLLIILALLYLIFGINSFSSNKKFDPQILSEERYTNSSFAFNFSCKYTCDKYNPNPVSAFKNFSKRQKLEAFSKSGAF